MTSKREELGAVKGKLSVILIVMMALVSGMGYNIHQSRNDYKMLVTMDSRLASTELLIKNSKKEHEERLSVMEKVASDVRFYCCGELDVLK